MKSTQTMAMARLQPKSLRHSPDAWASPSCKRARTAGGDTSRGDAMVIEPSCTTLGATIKVNSGYAHDIMPRGKSS